MFSQGFLPLYQIEFMDTKSHVVYLGIADVKRLRVTSDLIDS
jgi:hypothetical protein